MNIIHYDTISAYNASLGLETEHPLVAVVHLARHHELHEYDLAWGLYSLWLKDTHSCLINYGRTRYDYDCNSVMCFAPGQTVHITELEHERPSCTAVLFHPDLLLGTALAGKMSRYHFFGYRSTEALHVSAGERDELTATFARVKQELSRPVDAYSRSIIVAHLTLLLEQVSRMYSRQFIMREDLNRGVLAAFEGALDEWLERPRLAGEGFPSVQSMAERVHLSPNYFGDLVKKETGKTALEYIKLRLLDVAKQRLAGSDAPVSEVALSLGFEYPQHFTRYFKRMTALSPTQWRQRRRGA